MHNRTRVILGLVVALVPLACGDEHDSNTGQQGAAGAAATGGTAGNNGTGGSGAQGGSAGSGGQGATGAQGGSGGSAPVCAMDTELPSEISEAITLVKACSPYSAVTDVNVSAPLTIEAGVTVNFAAGKKLTVGGADVADSSFTVEGTPAEPVVFTTTDDPETGWLGVYLQSSATSAHSLKNLTIRNVVAGFDGSTAALLVNTAAPTTVENLSIEDFGTIGLKLDTPLAEGSSGITFVQGAGPLVRTWAEYVYSLPPITLGEGNSLEEIQIDGTGDHLVTGVVTWASQPAPLVLRTAITVTNKPSEATVLTIEENTVLSMGQGITVGGSAFMAQPADLIANNVTFDGYSAAMGWNGITFLDRFTDASTLSNVRVRHAGLGFVTDDQTMQNISWSVAVQFDPSIASWPKFENLTVESPRVVPDAEDACVVTSFGCGSNPPNYATNGNTLLCTRPTFSNNTCQ